MPELKQRFSLSIFQKILLTMLVVALVPFGSLWYLNHRRMNADWQIAIHQNLADTAMLLASQVDNWVDLNLRVLRQNAALEAIASMEAAQQRPVLRTISDTYEWAYLVFTIGPDGQNVGRSDNEPATQYRYADRRYFQQVMADQAVGQEVVIGRTTGKPALILAGPISREGQRVGVLALAIHLAEIADTVTNLKIGTSGYALLLDETGKAISHGRPGATATVLQDLSQHAALQPRQGGWSLVSYQEEGKPVVGYTQKTRHGWTLILQQDYDEAYAPLHQAQRHALIVLGGSLVLLLVLAYLLAQRLAEPIRELTRVAENLSRGKLDEQMVATERGDEIGALARAIERMGASIRLAFERLRSKL